MRKKLLVIIALGGTLAIVAAGSASSLSVGAGDLTVTVPGTDGGGGSGGSGGGTALPQCSDLADNDGDGLVDLADPGCSGPLDNDETNTASGGGGGGGGGTTTGGSGGGTTSSTTTTSGGAAGGKKGKAGTGSTGLFGKQNKK